MNPWKYRRLFFLLAPCTLLCMLVSAMLPGEAIKSNSIWQRYDETRFFESEEPKHSIGAHALIPLGGLLSRDQIILGGSFVLSEGESLPGNLFVLGGVATLEEGSIVEGSIFLMGGRMDVSGTVNEDIFAMGGVLFLTNTALVRGTVHTMGSNLQFASGASILGGIEKGFGEFPPWTFSTTPSVPWMREGLSLYAKLLWYLVRSILWAVLAILVVLFFPRQTHIVGKAAAEQPLIAVALGILTVFVAPILLLLLSVTIIGIPVALLVAFVLLLAWGFGIVSLGAETGGRLLRMLKVQWPSPIEAGMGTFMLTAVLNGIGALIPCLGWLVPFTVGSLGLGAALLTYFGNREFVASSTRGAGQNEANQLPESNQEGGNALREG